MLLIYLCCLLVLHVLWRISCSSCIWKSFYASKCFFGLLYYGFIFNLPEFFLFLFWTEAENNSVAQVNAQMAFTKGSGICSAYLKM